jgi:TetR/AcrR family transcriptional repressor of nem operon
MALDRLPPLAAGALLPDLGGNWQGAGSTHGSPRPATKAELGYRLIERYHAAFTARLAGIDATGAAAPEKLRLYARLYAAVVGDGRTCRCGMLAADFATLPEPMKAAIRRYFDAN